MRSLMIVAAAALVRSDGRLLLAQRPEGKTMAGLWEFPGGKIEAGESPQGALARANCRKSSAFALPKPT